MEPLLDGPMTLEEFVNLNVNAAIRLYQTRRMHLLTDDARYLDGAASALDAGVLLMQHQLSRKPVSEMTGHGATKYARQPHSRRTPLPELRQETARYKGVLESTSTPGKWLAKVWVRGKWQQAGTYATPLEAARGYDQYVNDHGLRCKTNAQLGLLG